MVVFLVLISSVKNGAFFEYELLVTIIDIIYALIYSDVHFFNEYAIGWNSVALININNIPND